MPVVTVSRASPGSPIGVLSYPYAPSVTEVVRRIPGRDWNKANKVWTIPLTPENVLLLRDGVKPLGFAVDLPRDLANDLNRAYKASKQAAAVRAAGDSDIEYEFVTEPYAHQRAGLAFLAHLDGGALLWEMGLGKTKTAIDFAEYLYAAANYKVADHGAVTVWHTQNPPFSVLVICPNTVKRNWGVEIEKHTRGATWAVPKGTLKERVTQLGMARYTIVNAEALSHNVMARGLQSIMWDLVIVDESTRFKTPGAARTKALMKLRTKRRVILTGTPITGKPQDAYIQFEWVRPGTFGKSYFAFADRYLQKDWFGSVIGIKPGMEDDLRTRIDAAAYRILKADVLDLPPKVYSTRTVTMTGEQLRAYRQMRDELRIELFNGDDLRASNILTVLLRLTQVTAGLVGETGRYQWLKDNAKQDELEDLLDGDLAGEQVVIFGLYQKELEELAARFDRSKSITHDGLPLLPIIYGPTPESVRHDLITGFQAGDRRLLFAQVRTGGIGINLTAAKTAIYYTRSWSLEEWLQSQDRLHRIGQTGTVNIVSLEAEDSIDQDISRALADKQNLADNLTGDSARALAARIVGR